MTEEGRKALDLFWTFAKIGLFTFGGGYAMIPLIQREAAETKHWVSDRDILDIVAVAESTPGPIAINAATFIGKRVAGFRGAVCATCGVVLPSFLIIMLISAVLQAFREFPAVRYAFLGIRAGVLALILKALYTLFRQCRKDWFSWAVMGFALAGAAFLRVNVILIIAVCGCGGVAYTLACGRRK